TANGECTFGEVFATDGRVPALDLVVLEDDQAYFPRYNLSGVIQEELYEQYPQIEELIDPLSEHLDNETMAEQIGRASCRERDWSSDVCSSDLPPTANVLSAKSLPPMVACRP